MAMAYYLVQHKANFISFKTDYSIDLRQLSSLFGADP